MAVNACIKKHGHIDSRTHPEEFANSPFGRATFGFKKAAPGVPLHIDLEGLD